MECNIRIKINLIIHTYILTNTHTQYTHTHARTHIDKQLKSANICFCYCNHIYGYPTFVSPFFLLPFDNEREFVLSDSLAVLRENVIKSMTYEFQYQLFSCLLMQWTNVGQINTLERKGNWSHSIKVFQENRRNISVASGIFNSDKSSLTWKQKNWCCTFNPC